MAFCMALDSSHLSPGMRGGCSCGMACAISCRICSAESVIVFSLIVVTEENRDLLAVGVKGNALSQTIKPPALNSNPTLRSLKFVDLTNPLWR
jgi:hypothetical protein